MSSDNSTKKRTFKLIDSSVSFTGDHVFHSATPKSASLKALSSICRQNKMKGPCEMTVSLQETTRNSSGKTFTYKVSREEEPKTVERNGVEITYNYVNKSYAVKGSKKKGSKKKDSKKKDSKKKDSKKKDSKKKDSKKKRGGKKKSSKKD